MVKGEGLKPRPEQEALVDCRLHGLSAAGTTFLPAPDCIRIDDRFPVGVGP